MARTQAPAPHSAGRLQSAPSPARLLPAASPDAPKPSRALTAAICLVLVLATAAVYAQVRHFGFVEYDDGQYMSNEAYVKNGLTSADIHWAFTNFDSANWHPLTWLSLQLDCQIFGVKPGIVHVINVLYHIAATLLIFLAFVRMTNRPWRSAALAAIFALHPTHVESVAWISERKDVLSTFFASLALLLYARYAAKPSILRYIPIMLAFALALMAKSMFVTLPFVFLLLDLWPMKRLAWPPSWKSLKWPLFEKVPLIAMSVALSVITYIAQHEGGAVSDFARMPFKQRLGNVCVAYASYVGKAIAPLDLGVMYPILVYRGSEILACLLLVVALCAVAVLMAKKYPYYLVGWCWFLGTLVPVIGLVTVGAQLIADRYMYFPIIGLSFAVVWLVADLCAGSLFLQRIAGGIGLAVMIGFAVLTYQQVGCWSSSEALFRHTIAVTNPNPIMHTTLAVVLKDAGKVEEAIREYQAAIKIHPAYSEAHNGLGMIYYRRKQYDEALVEYEAAVAGEGESAAAHNNIGAILDLRGKHDEAKAHYQRALELQGDFPDAHSNLGQYYAMQGKTDQALEEYNKVLKMRPDDADAHNAIGAILASQKKNDEAVLHYRAAIAAKPENANALANLGHELLAKGQLQEAFDLLSKAVKIQPAHQQAQSDLGVLYAAQGKFADAVDHLQESLRAKPDQPETMSNLAFALNCLGRYDEAIAQCNAALKLDPKCINGHYNLANALAAKGDTASAINEFNAVLALSPSHTAARAALEKLKGSK